MKSAITISIDKGLLRACRSAAFAARRTLSSQIEQWIDEKLALEAAASGAGSAPASPARSTPAPERAGRSAAPRKEVRS